MSVVYKLVGYSRTTGYQTVSYDIPDELVKAAKLMAGIKPDDPSIVGDVPLDFGQARAIAEMLKTQINTRDLEFFLEPYDKDKRTPQPSVA